MHDQINMEPQLCLATQRGPRSKHSRLGFEATYEYVHVLELAVIWQ